MIGIVFHSDIFSWITGSIWKVELREREYLLSIYLESNIFYPLIGFPKGCSGQAWFRPTPKACSSILVSCMGIGSQILGLFFFCFPGVVETLSRSGRSGTWTCVHIGCLLRGNGLIHCATMRLLVVVSESLFSPLLVALPVTFFALRWFIYNSHDKLIHLLSISRGFFECIRLML